MNIQAVFSFVNSTGNLEDKVVEIDINFVYALVPGDIINMNFPEDNRLGSRNISYKFRIVDRTFDKILSSPQYVEFRCTQI